MDQGTTFRIEYLAASGGWNSWWEYSALQPAEEVFASLCSSSPGKAWRLVERPSGRVISLHDPIAWAAQRDLDAAQKPAEEQEI